MVAVIKHGHSLRNIVSYNERKVQEGVAECIGEVNYPKDLEWLSFNNKLSRLTNQAQLNPRVTSNAVHISLNFDPSEHLSREKLNEIADTYMRKIGMDDLPYLVYQHHDAGHPHIHIATVKVRSNGKRVNMDYMGQNQSTVAREEIEKEFGLVVAKGRGNEDEYAIQPADVEKARYGKTPTKRAITNVLTEVISKYSYASLHELNAILSLYNVYADPGAKGSRINDKKGLSYRLLDEQGNKVGVPIKASLFYNKPTQKNLATEFAYHEGKRKGKEKHIKLAIDKYFLSNTRPTMEGLKLALKKEGISTVPRKGDKGITIGITFVDHKHKTVFNGSTVAEGYSYHKLMAKMTSIRTNPHAPVSHKPYARKQQVSRYNPQNQKTTRPTESPADNTTLKQVVLPPKSNYRSWTTKPKDQWKYKTSTFNKGPAQIPFYNKPNSAAIAYHKANGWIDIVLSADFYSEEPLPYQFMNGRYKKKRKKSGN